MWGLNAVVAINRFSSDTDAEIALVQSECAAHGADAIPCDVWGKGGEGALALAGHVKQLCADPRPLQFTYPDELPLDKKITAVARRIYGAAEVKFAPGVRTKLKQFAEMGYASAPVCIAKTQYSLTDDMSRLGAPRELYAQCARRAAKCRRGIRGRIHRRDNRDAGSAQISGGRAHRRVGRRRDIGAVLRRMERNCGRRYDELPHRPVTVADSLALCRAVL